MSNSVRPYRQQPTRVLHPQDSPGKNTGVGCYFLLHLDFKVPVKLTTTMEGEGKRKKKKSKSIYRIRSQNIRIINVFFWVTAVRVLSLSGSHSLPHLPRMPSHCANLGPAVETAHILIWSYSCMFLPLMSTAIRTSGFSFVGALNDLLYIK